VSIFTRNTTTGALSGTTTIATGAAPNGVCISADGTSVYTANYSGLTASIFNRS
jgi:DNA-binding beta-propeller fold protein YncE